MISIYMVFHNTRTNIEKSKVVIQVLKSNEIESKVYSNEDVNSVKVNFCYYCGEKLDGKPLK